MGNPKHRPVGYRWRSSKLFIIGTMCIALYAETFLYGFIVPMLGYMFQTRLHRDPSETQWFTSAILAVHGYVSALSGPIIGHFADKSPDRKTPLVLSLVVCVIGTVMIAWCSSLTVLFAGRILQGIAGTVVWIVGLASIAATVSPDRIGTTMGVAMSFVNAGTISGPMASGLLLEWSGYWATWSIPLVVLVIDIALRLIMIEKTDTDQAPSTPPLEETTTLLRETPHQPAAEKNFWKTMLRDSRVIVALAVQVTTVSLSSSFSATLPLHVQKTFGWGTAVVGLQFTYLAVPGLLFSPLVGWIRDRIGVRYPTVVAFIFLSMSLWLLGVPGNDHFPWAGASNRGPAVYTAAIIFYGIVRPFSSGVAPLELTSVVNEYHKKQPGIFGPRGGLSRVFSMIEIAAASGLTVGPIISGFLVETVNYTTMAWTLSK
ncbi:hypothetical protein FE257_009181 [Aspergillus nanangensis]|uniref:Major facilitator superfamily (MFS) profile domain-containing protein n=1 Tax=Aspergillus nanangensis TaxID=2582783 RepID=A0AAD4CKF6_ASPNN|nr:hypothetical protein FE257_009181 [Aspergillus nanangensis]